MNKLYVQKIKAVVHTIETNERFLGAILIYLATISVLLAFPIFPLAAVPLIALIPAIAAYYNPALGTVLSVLFANMAVAYQSPVLGWIFTLILSITLVAAFRFWYIIALLELLIFAPFAKGLQLLGGIIIPVIFLSALRLGAKRSLLITLPAVYFVLLLTAIWGVDNGAFLTINHSFYENMRTAVPEQLLLPSKQPVSLFNTAGAVGEAVGGMFSGDALTYINPLIGLTSSATVTLFFGDVGLLQIVGVGVLMYIASFLPGALRHRYEQTIATLIFWLFIPMHFFFAQLTGSVFRIEVVAYAMLTTALVYYLDVKKVYIAGQTTAVLREKEKKFSQYGVQDLGLASRTKLSDVGNYDDVKKELKSAILMPLRRKDISMAYGIKPPKGILLFGPPGTGKTLLMRAFASELEIGFYYVKASQLLSQYFGESEKNVSKIFDIARKNAPAVLFFDEIDAIGKSRGEYGRGDEAAARVLSTVLEEMDGLSSESNVLVVGATNMPQVLDRALLRPGRLDKIIYMHLPDMKGRLRILQIYTKDMPLADDVDIEKIAKKTERYSGADVANLCKEVKGIAAKSAMEKEEIVPVKMADFEKVMKSLKPSTTIDMLDKYERFRLDYERRIGEEEQKVKKFTWEDVVGLDEVRKMLKEAIEIPLLHEELLEKYDVKPSKGLLMFGPPGCGKTLIVKAAANELNVNVMSVSGAELLKRGYEGAVAVIKETFNRARENTPAIVFIDEIESIAPSRELYSSKYVEDVVTQLLQEMDGMKELKGVLLIGATNKPEMLDKALLRPGRLDKIVFVPPPLKEQRAKMFERFLRKVPRGGIDYEALAEAGEGFTGADINSVCQEAKFMLVRKSIAGKKDVKLETADVLKVIERRRPSLTVEMLKQYKLFMDEYGERK